MPHWQGKSRGTPLGYRIFIFAIKWFGIGGAYFMLRFVAAYFYFFSYKSSRPIFYYLKHRQGFGRLKSLRLLYRNYYVFGQTLIDKIIVMSGLKNTFTFSFDGEENLRQMKDGGILLSAHVGNWEAAGHLLERLNQKINVVMLDAEHQKIKDTIEQTTGGKNFNVIAVKEDLSHVYAIHEALGRKELVCLHADRFVGETKTFEQNFLGAKAAFPAGVFALAGTTRTPVSIVFAFKETKSHYHFYGSDCLQQDKDEPKHDYISRLKNTFILELEQKLKLYPEQWFNYYQFWK